MTLMCCAHLDLATFFEVNLEPATRGFRFLADSRTCVNYIPLPSDAKATPLNKTSEAEGVSAGCQSAAAY